MTLLFKLSEEHNEDTLVVEYKYLCRIQNRTEQNRTEQNRSRRDETVQMEDEYDNP